MEICTLSQNVRKYGTARSPKVPVGRARGLQPRPRDEPRADPTDRRFGRLGAPGGSRPAPERRTPAREPASATPLTHRTPGSVSVR